MAGVEAVRVLSVLDETVEGMRCVTHLVSMSPHDLESLSSLSDCTSMLIMSAVHIVLGRFVGACRPRACRLLSYVTPSVLRAPDQVEALLGKARLTTSPSHVLRLAVLVLLPALSLLSHCRPSFLVAGLCTVVRHGLAMCRASQAQRPSTSMRCTPERARTMRRTRRSSLPC